MSSLFILLVCLLTCCGQLCQKQAVHNWTGKNLTLRKKIFDPWLMSALASLGIGMLVWLYVLRLVPLNIAYPMLSLNFVFVTLASHFWFGEQMSLRGWFGILLIMLGVVLLGLHL